MKSLWEKYRKRGRTCGQSERPLRRLCLRDMEPSAPAAGFGAYIACLILIEVGTEYIEVACPQELLS